MAGRKLMNHTYTFSYDNEEEKINFARPFESSDVIFLVEDKEIHACKAVLTLASKRFKSILQGYKHGERHIMDGIRYNDFYCLMEVLHQQGGCTRLKGEQVCEILHLIEHYEIFGLKNECEKYLLSIGEELRHLAIARNHNFEHLERKTLEWAAMQSMDTLKENPDWGIVEENYRLIILEDIVRRYEKLLQSEDHNPIDRLKKQNKELMTRNKEMEKAIESLKEENQQLQKRLEKYQDLKSDYVAMKHKNQNYKDFIARIKAIVDGNGVQGKSLNKCASSFTGVHIKGTNTKCVPCRSEIFVILNRYINDNVNFHD